MSDLLVVLHLQGQVRAPKIHYLFQQLPGCRCAGKAGVFARSSSYEHGVGTCVFALLRCQQPLHSTFSIPGLAVVFAQLCIPGRQPALQAFSAAACAVGLLQVLVDRPCRLSRMSRYGRRLLKSIDLQFCNHTPASRGVR